MYPKKSLAKRCYEPILAFKAEQCFDALPSYVLRNMKWSDTANNPGDMIITDHEQFMNKDWHRSGNSGATRILSILITYDLQSFDYIILM